MRKEFTRKVKSMAFERSGGRCEVCTAKLSPSKFEYDHVVPCALGGSNDLSNCRVTCSNCHGEKTFKTDIPMIRKSDRVRDKHNGAFRKSSRGFRKAPPQRSASRKIEKWSLI